jgi:hypothetical protein
MLEEKHVLSTYTATVDHSVEDYHFFFVILQAAKKYFRQFLYANNSGMIDIEGKNYIESYQNAIRNFGWSFD